MFTDSPLPETLALIDDLQVRGPFVGSPDFQAISDTILHTLRQLVDDIDPGPAPSSVGATMLPLLYLSTTYRILACVLRREYSRAWAEAEPLSRDWRRQLMGTYCQPIHGLVALIAAAEQFPTASRRPRLRRLMRGYRRVLARWAADCPENYGPMLALADAELASLAGRYGDAITAYERALADAETNRMPWLAGLAADRLSQQTARQAHALFAEQARARARALYLRWGARALVRGLDGLQPEDAASPP